MLTPAAAYLRRSTSKQEASVGDQRAEMPALAAKYGCEVVAEYCDDAISGDKTEKRDAFLRMVRDAAAGRFRVILAWNLDRFGRFDPIDGGFYIKPLRDAGVRLVTAKDGEVDWLTFGGRIQWFVNQEQKHGFLRDLSHNVLRGMIAKAKQGRRVGGSPPFGYVLEDGKLTLGPHAPAVRKLFLDYVNGGTLRGLAEDLNRRGFVTPRLGRPWDLSSVRSVLTNPAYVGDFVWGKVATGKYYRHAAAEIVAGNGVTGPSRDGERLVIPDVHPAIVDRATFEAARRVMLRNRRHTSPNAEFIFSGLVVCGHCGWRMYGANVNRATPMYVCRNRRAHAAVYSVTQEHLRKKVGEHIREHLGTQAAVKRMIDKAEAALAAKEGAADPKALRAALAAAEKRVEAVAARLMSVDHELLREAEKAARRIIAERDQIRDDLARAERSSSSRGASRTAVAREIAAAARDFLKGDAEKDAVRMRRSARGILAELRLTFESRPAVVRQRHSLANIAVSIVGFPRTC